MPQISVILCNYNYANFVGEAISSVLAQDYDDYELIIVDDGSTDSSVEVISRYKDPRIKTILKRNGGQSSSFNVAFENATGKYIAFIDSDDTWKKNKLSKVSECFSKYDKLSLVQHRLELIDRNTRRLHSLHPPGLKPGRRDLLKMYFRSNHTNYFSATSGLVASYYCLSQIFPLDESWRICSDVLVTRPMPLFGAVFTLKEALGSYRIHGSNYWMNTSEQKKVMENQLKYVEYTNNWLAKCGYERMIDYSKSAAYRQVIRDQSRGGVYRKILKRMKRRHDKRSD